MEWKWIFLVTIVPLSTFIELCDGITDGITVGGDVGTGVGTSDEDVVGMVD